MEALPPRLMTATGPARWTSMGVLFLAIVCAPGCTLDHYLTGNDDGLPSPGQPCELATAWLNRVQYAPDTEHEGSPTPGLVGRLYLFDKTEKYPVIGDGSVLVTLFDDTHGPSAQPLEQWNIDPVALRKFAKKDTVGWGYTLFLPWSSCRPDVSKVHLTCRYEPLKGTPIFGPVSPLTLEHDAPPAGAPIMTSPPPAIMPQLPMPKPLR